MAPSKIFSSCCSKSLFFYYFSISEYVLIFFSFIFYLSLVKEAIWCIWRLQVNKLVSNRCQTTKTFSFSWGCVHPNVDLLVESVCIEVQKLALFEPNLQKVVSNFSRGVTRTPSRSWFALLFTRFAHGPFM